MHQSGDTSRLRVKQCRKDTASPSPPNFQIIVAYQVSFLKKHNLDLDDPVHDLFDFLKFS